MQDRPPPSSGVVSTFAVPAMDCATEKDVIANRLGRLGEVEGVDFDLLERTVTVRHREGAEALIGAALDEIGMRPRRVGRGEDACCETAAAEGATSEDDDRPTAMVWRLGLAGASALAAELLAITALRESSWPVIAMSVAAIALSGPGTFRKGLTALRTRTLNINLLMSIAITGALAIGEWPEAAMVTVLFAVAELIESRSAERARDAIRGLMALSPETARLRRGDAWVEVPARSVHPGALVRVLPGERIPLDGTVRAGASAVDQAPITGESVPVDKVAGDPVFAGTINQQGALEIEVTSDQDDSTLARIGRAIRQAQTQKAPTERFVDQFARWYTPTVVLLAAGVTAIPPLVFGAAFLPWLYKALVLLVIACPCALVISTPVTVVSGLAGAARRGILVKGGVHLEQARRLRVLALDKTGTLTEGKPTVVDVVPMNGASADEVLQRAASLEAHSMHPLAQAVVRRWPGALLQVSDVRDAPGRGIEAEVGGVAMAIGSHRFAEERGVCSPAIEAQLARLEAHGKSVMVVWTAEQVIGVLAVADAVRTASIEAIRALHGQGVRLAMLTGDNPTTARAVADEVGIDEVEADLLPEDKLAAIDRLGDSFGPVGMVGDGVNDAPALARAHIGFAMGAAGTDTAIETADVALMRDDLRAVPTLIELSHRTARTLRVNIAFSISIKVVFFALALAGLANLWMAVFADMGASLLVAANGLRLLRVGDGG